MLGSPSDPSASADPLAGSVSDPQSLNRYAYVLNDPVNQVDPLGLRFSYICGFTHECLGGGAGLRMDEGCGGPFSLACDGGGTEFIVDGIAVSAQMAGWLLQTGAGVECPNDVCAGFLDGQYLQFTCSGGACGYLTQQQQYTMGHVCGGSFCDDRGYLQWAIQNSPEAAAGQFKALAKELADKLGISVADAMTQLIEALYSGDSSTAYLSGGNLNFEITGD